MTTLAVRAAWKPRPENEATVAAQLSAFLPHLRALSPAYASLTRARNSPRQPLLPIPDDATALTEELCQGRIRNDTDRSIMPGAGFSCHWDDNTRRFDQASLSIDAGSETRGGSIWVDAPPEIVSSLTPATMRPVLTAVVRQFDPDSAAVNESSDIVTRNARNEFINRVGWLLYLRDGPPIPPIDGVEVSPLGRGRLYVVDEPTFDPTSARYQQRVKALYLALRAVGADVGEPIAAP